MAKLEIFHDLPEFMTTEQVVDRLRELATCSDPDGCGSGLHEVAASLADKVQAWYDDGKALEEAGAIRPSKDLIRRKEDLMREICEFNLDVVMASLLDGYSIPEDGYIN